MSANTMCDLRVTMAAARSLKAARNIVAAARNRIADVEYIGWPALEQSLKRELADCERIAREKGLML